MSDNGNMGAKSHPQDINGLAPGGDGTKPVKGVASPLNLEIQQSGDKNEHS